MRMNNADDEHGDRRHIDGDPRRRNDVPNHRHRSLLSGEAARSLGAVVQKHRIIVTVVMSQRMGQIIGFGANETRGSGDGGSENRRCPEACVFAARVGVNASDRRSLPRCGAFSAERENAMRRVTKEPCFGPKLLGWGWRSITWQGWLLSLLLVALPLGVRWELGTSMLAFGAMIVVIALFALIAWLTSGRPGSVWRR